MTEEKTKLLMNRMRYPSLSLHGIFGGAERESTIIPHEVTGEFSIRSVPIFSFFYSSVDKTQNFSLVPNQTPAPGSMGGLVESYLIQQLENLHTKCTMIVTETPGSASPWLGNVDGASYQAAKKAIEVRIHDPTLILYLRTHLYHYHRLFTTNLPTLPVKGVLLMLPLHFPRWVV